MSNTITIAEATAAVSTADARLKGTEVELSNARRAMAGAHGPAMGFAKGRMNRARVAHKAALAGWQKAVDRLKAAEAALAAKFAPAEKQDAVLAVLTAKKLHVDYKRAAAG